MVSEDLAELAADAYVYGFPLVFDLRMAGGKADMGMVAPAPFNSFSHAARLAGPDDRFVSINNDTIYSIAQVDVSGGPVLLRVPDAAGRYYVLQFVDAWTNNFAYLGRRTTGTAAGSFLLTPPRWQGQAPDGAAVIEFPTNLATIVGRWACDGPADLEAVGALQRGLALEPSAPRTPPAGLPAPAAVPAELAFFEQLRAWMHAFPPSAQDQDYQQRFAPLGLLDPAWKMPDRHASYLARALAARGGLWGNHGYEAAYPMTYTDADGDRLDGRNRYTLTFDQDPPVDAFWSITMYDLPDFYLVANPIGRYSIGDRTPGLRRGADGSLTIAIQHQPPPDTSNWLPAPAAPFRPLMRLYQPQPAILEGTYKIPPITKAAR